MKPPDTALIRSPSIRMLCSDLGCMSGWQVSLQRVCHPQLGRRRHSSASTLLRILHTGGLRRLGRRRDDKSKMPRNARLTPDLNRGRAMPTVQPFPAGGYRFIIHQFQYSGGVAAEPGFRIEHARFARPLPLAEGFDAIEAYLAGIGRSPTAFCACELRSPTQFSDAGFVAFNRHYVERLAAWGIFRDEVNPVARSNVCPEIDPPATPSFYAFSYTVPSETARPAALSPPEAAKRARAAPAMKGASFGAATSRLRRCARKRASCSGRWSGASRRSASAGRM